LAGLLRWLDPDFRGTPSSAAAPEGRVAGGSFSRLFGDGLAAITLSMWLLFFTNAVALSVVSSWLPTTLRSLGLGMGETGRVTAYFSVAGMVGCLIVAGLITRAGVLVLPGLFVTAVVCLFGFAVLDVSYTAILLCVLVAGLTTASIQIACTTDAGTLYPTAIRASGVGWAYAMGRVGAIVGPFFGGLVYALHLPPQRLFTFAAIPMAVGAVCAILLPVLCIRRFGAVRVDRADREDAPPPASRSESDNRRAATAGAAMVEGAQASPHASPRAPK
jgi:AAHS family 4-hydroxybenzoate transporter-like MFS transporter